MSRWSHLSFIALILSSFATFAPQAHAKSCSKTVVVLDFSGNAAQVRNAIVKTLLAQGCELLPSSDVQSRFPNLSSSDDYKAAAAAFGIAAFVEGSVAQEGKKWKAEATVINAASGEKIKNTNWTARTLRALSQSAQRSAWSRLGGSIEQTSTPDTASASATGPADSQPGSGKRIAVLSFEGPRGATARQAMVDALQAQGHDVVQTAETDAVVESLGGIPDNPEGYEALAKDLKVDGFVTGTLTQKRNTYTLSSSVLHGRDGQEVGTSSATASGRNAIAQVVEKVAEKLSPMIDKTQGHGTAADSDTEQSTLEDDPAPTPKDPDEPMKYVALDVFAGARFFSRSLSYTDDRDAALRGYSVVPALALAVGATWFPGAHVSNGIAAHIGLQGYFERSFGLSSTVDGDASEFPTTASAFSVGIVGRLPLDDLEILPALSYGNRSFTIEAADAETPVPDIADVSYSHIRLGASLRYALGSGIAIFGGLGYHMLLSAGQIEDDYFPNLSGGGLDVSLGGALNLIAGLEARLELNMQRYFMSMNPNVDDTLIAGGALDQWFGATLSLAYRLGGPDPSE